MRVIPFNPTDLLNAADAQFIGSTKVGKGKVPVFGAELSDAEIED